MSEQLLSSPDTIRVEIDSPKPKNSKTYVIDLRIKSPGSLSYFSMAKLDTAPAMVRLAKAKGLDLIAITDYYTGSFVDQAKQAGKVCDITVLPGVMIRAAINGCDEVKFCCIFPEDFNSVNVSGFLQELEVPASAAYSKNYIIKKTLSEIIEIAKRHQALLIPSRMDRTPSRKQAIYSLVNDYGFKAFEVAHYDDAVEWFKQEFPDKQVALFSFSNANVLAQVGNRSTVLSMSKPGFDGLRSFFTSLD